MNTDQGQAAVSGRAGGRTTPRAHVLAVGDERSYATSTGATRGSYQIDFEATLADLIGGLDDGATVAELGAGANPNLAGHERVQSGELDLLLIDISQQELDKAPTIGRKLCVDVAGADVPLAGSVDLACSQMLAEHVADGAQFLRNIAKMLKPGGLYLQVSPVLYTVPFAVNRVIPERLSSVLLDVFQPRDHYQHAKFPARYSLCRGPATKHIARLEQSGLRVVAARGYYGHNYYGRVPGLRDLEGVKSRYLAANPMPLFCSFGVYLFTRP